ncbi:MAG: toll/interleukin-1 receptor domain-containing protein [Verrucomicrobiota bacterium]
MTETPHTKVEVFISHKHEDETTAALLNQRLELYGAGRVSSFISERISPGVDWFDKIRERLSTADVLILLFTATHASWDWPLYEVGLATNIDDESPCRIVCFHPPDTSPPDPIKFTQAVKADEEGIEDFLYKFFCTSEITGCDPPVNSKLAEDRAVISQLAVDVAKGFKAVKPWKNYFTNFLWVIIDEGKVDEEEIPKSARIDPESSGLAMFRVTPKPPTRDFWTWGELLAKANREDDEGWIKALGERFYWASRGSNLRSMTHNFTCMRTGNIFRPLLNRVELRSDNSMLFEIILVEHITPTA